MRTIIITIGDELLIGQTVDTNSSWMGAEMSKIGFDIVKKVSIHDKREDILDELSAASGKYDVVLITGGLGPTSDDITKQTLCEYFDTKLVRNDEVLEMVTKMILGFKSKMNSNNYRQAEVPETCRVLKNAVGTAPGMWFEKDRTIFISMPGVPFEMKYLMEKYVLPELKLKFNTQTIIHKNIMTYGIGESILAEKLSQFEANLGNEIKIAYLPGEGVLKLRLTGIGPDREKLIRAINDKVGELYKIIPEYIFAEDEESMESSIGKLLVSRNATLSTAESCTGGNIAKLITSVPGSSKYYKGSIIAYSNIIKEELLGVSDKTIADEGAVSKAVVEAMAKGARKVFNTDYAVATSGIAGPDGGSESKPVGTVWIAVDSQKGTVSSTFNYGSDRINNIKRFTSQALAQLRKHIIS